jgi:hypothetical protein
MVVDLPAPFAPIYPTISHISKENEISLTASMVEDFILNSVLNIPTIPGLRTGRLKFFLADLTSIIGILILPLFGHIIISSLLRILKIAL